MKTFDGMITVGMPVYNAMRWLPEAMESLLHQTSACFEILAVVDGATDGSLDYLRSLKDPRLHILEQDNQGVTATLNRLLAEVRTPWLVRQDADDVSYPRRIEALQQAIEEHPDAGLIYSLADYHPKDKCAGKFRCSRGTSEELRSIVKRGQLLSICHSSVAINAEKARAAGGYRMDLHAEDADLWWRMALRYEVHCIPEALVGFRLNALGVSASHAEQQELAGLYVQYLLLSELWHRRPRAFTAVAPALLQFWRPSRMAAKQSLQRFNICLGEGRQARAILALTASFLQSPAYVARRIRDELRSGSIANGIPPQRFLERQDALWS